MCMYVFQYACMLACLLACLPASLRRPSRASWKRCVALRPPRCEMCCGFCFGIDAKKPCLPRRTFFFFFTGPATIITPPRRPRCGGIGTCAGDSRRQHSRRLWLAAPIADAAAQDPWPVTAARADAAGRARWHAAPCVVGAAPAAAAQTSSNRPAPARIAFRDTRA